VKVLRAWKRYLWRQIAPKVERYARCRQCSMLLLITDEKGNDDPEVLEQHLGHFLEEVTHVNTLEWTRIRAGF
jgi:glycine/D-amino acid oxidase-like deaminating enzyme